MKSQLTDRQAARRDRVIQAAMDLASQGGYDAVQMREVAANADVALGTLYRYFASKDQLLVAVLSFWARELQQQIASRPPAGGSTQDRVAEVMRRASGALEASPQLTSALVTALSSLSSDDQEALEQAKEIQDVVNDIVSIALPEDRGRKEGVVRVLGLVWFAALFTRVRGWSDPREMGDDLELAVRLLLPEDV